MYKLVLASASPRRSDILTMLGYSFSVRPSDCDETVPESFSARQTVETLSKRKAEAVKRGKGEKGDEQNTVEGIAFLFAEHG